MHEVEIGLSPAIAGLLNFHSETVLSNKSCPAPRGESFVAIWQPAKAIQANDCA